MTAGDELREAIVALRPELLRRARWMTGRTDAEDLVHDTIARALTFEAGYEPGTIPRAWLHRVLFSVFVEGVRRRRHDRRGREELRDVEASWAHGDSPPAAETFLSPAIARTLAELPAAFLLPVLLVDLGDRSYLEAAAELGIPLGTVMSRLHRGRRRLAAQLVEEDLC